MCCSLYGGKRRKGDNRSLKEEDRKLPLEVKLLIKKVTRHILYIFMLIMHIKNDCINHLECTQDIVYTFLILIATTCGTLALIPNNSHNINNSSYYLMGAHNESDKSIVMIIL